MSAQSLFHASRQRKTPRPCTQQFREMGVFLAYYTLACVNAWCYFCAVLLNFWQISKI